MNQLHLFAARYWRLRLGFTKLIAAQHPTVANNRSAAPATLRNAALALIALGLHAWATFSAMVTDSGIDLALVMYPITSQWSWSPWWRWQTPACRSTA